MSKKTTNKKALTELEKNYGEAKKILEDRDKLEELLQKTERKLQVIPKLGDKLSHIPVFASLIKSYVKKEYTEVPMGTIIAVLAAIIYFVSPIDIIPDVFPGVGHIDDAAVIVACLSLVDSDIEDYIKWREINGKKLDV